MNGGLSRRVFLDHYHTVQILRRPHTVLDLLTIQINLIVERAVTLTADFRLLKRHGKEVVESNGQGMFRVELAHLNLRRKNKTVTIQTTITTAKRVLSDIIKEEQTTGGLLSP